MRNARGELTQSWVMLMKAVKCQIASKIRLQVRPSCRSTSRGNHAMNPSPVHWMNSPWMAWIASDETQWRRGRNASMCSAKSSLLIKLDELEMSHTQSTPRSLWTVSAEYPRRGNSCISICARLRNPVRGLTRECAASRGLRDQQAPKDRYHLCKSIMAAIVRLKQPWAELSRYHPLFTMFYSHHPHQKISTTPSVAGDFPCLGGVPSALGFRVEPMVTHPAPPQPRTCVMSSSGSSGARVAA